MTQIYRRHDQLSDIERFGKPIWETPFLVSITYKDTCSPEYIRLFGMPTVGDPTIDASMHNSLDQRYITIDKMIEYFKRGIPVRVVKHEDTKNIYEIINNYLLAWKANLTHGINIGDAPVEDLILMDRFAHVVYQHAVQHFTPEFVNSRMLQAMNGGGLWKSRETLSKPKTVDDKGQEVMQPQRESMANLFSERIVRGGKAPVKAGQGTPTSRWMRSKT